jgi:IS30 family transposase
MPTAYRAFANDIKQFTPQTLKALCDALKCSPNEIFGYEKSQTVKPQLVKVDSEKPASKPGTPQTTVSEGDLLTVEQAAKLLNRSPRQVRTYAKEGILKGKQGKQNHWFFNLADVEDCKRNIG